MNAERAAAGVIDLISSNKLSEAQVALENALLKYPKNNNVEVAEACLLLQNGQVSIAKEKAEFLSTQGITNPTAINALINTLQRCCAWKALVTIFERNPAAQTDKKTLESLALTYVRMRDYAKVQEIATQLYRRFNEAKHQVWLVQACLGQVPRGSKDHLALRLATKLLEAAVLTEKGVIVPTTVQTYVDALIQQMRYDDAVGFLCSKLGARIGVLETRLEVLAKVLKSQGHLAKANAVAKFLWKRRPENWTSFEAYVNTLSDAKAEVSEERLILENQQSGQVITIDYATKDNRLEDALRLAKELQAEKSGQDGQKLERGPFLAELSLLGRLDATALQTAVLTYAQRFYHNPSCFLDLSTFLTSESSLAIYNWSICEETETDDRDEASLLRSHYRRILGIRCLVSSWGLTSESQPTIEEMQTLIKSCLSAYNDAKPLSTSLAWSEEGLCDGYISVALNIALRGYLSHEKDLQWIVDGLNMLKHVDRRMNNPGWLMISVCFAQMLGLVDTAALHQLSFRSVQHDTMTHIGYWPLVRGLELKKLATWESMAMDYYSRLERDCSQLRTNIFTYISWPAIQDVHEFEENQENSLSRWLIIPHECVSKLKECQTQKSIFELLLSRGPELWNASQKLYTEKVDVLTDNTDLLVVKSVILADIHSEEAQQLTDKLVGMSTFECRLTRGLQMLESLLMLHDLVRLERHRHELTTVSKPRKSNKKALQNINSAQKSHPRLYCPSLLDLRKAKEQWNGRRLDCFPAINTISEGLLSYILSDGTAVVSYDDAFGDYLQALVSEDNSSANFEEFLYPEAYILVSLVRTGDLSKIPVKKWAVTLQRILETALSRYESGVWPTLAAITVAPDDLVENLLQEKLKRVKRYLSDLIVDVAASTRRN
ncbi:unnamed protein product [Phytomonas sp. Hart1]|nr:unnamed protein product [Phytomonas sp. Hart1]|eukprot:CCW67963.1 unnamed protein product [Phytomonas sp. isolate Hart1]